MGRLCRWGPPCDQLDRAAEAAIAPADFCRRVESKARTAIRVDPFCHTRGIVFR
jgi:hypothetical protein